MPERSGVQSALRRSFHRWPAIQRLSLALLDGWYQLALLPFRRRRVRGRAREDAALVAATDSYNDAAERYFAEFEDRQFLLGKPFSETSSTARHLIDAGVLIDAMRLHPRDVVVEIGAGSCWLSQMLNRYGCRTIAIDVSATALALGRELFEQDPRTNWTLDPQFLTYDGHVLPLADESCDRVVINDAFHHIPNQRELLREVRRVLRRDGILAMAEPGYGHGSGQHAVDEAATGVLENELVLEDVAALARECGFAAVNVLVTGPHVRREIPTHELAAFMGGKGFAGYWKEFCSALEQHHYIVCHATAAEATTRRPLNLSAAIHVSNVSIALRHDQNARVTLHVTNAGDTRWLARGEPGNGWTRIGAHLYRDSAPPELLDRDWWRSDLPSDVAPGTRFHADVTLPRIASPGAYLVVFDLVVEGVCWFADRGSRTTSLRVTVG